MVEVQPTVGRWNEICLLLVTEYVPRLSDNEISDQIFRTRQNLLLRLCFLLRGLNKRRS